MLRAVPFLMFLLLALAGCDFPLTQDDVRNSPEGMLLHRVVDELKVKGLKAIERDCTATLTALPNFEKALATIAALVPGENAKTTNFTSWDFNWDGSGERTAAITAAYEYVGYYLQVSIATRGIGERLIIESIDVQRIEEATLATDL